MRIAVLDDYQDALRSLPCYARLMEHEVVIYRDTVKDIPALAERLRDADAVILTQQRSPFPRALIERLPNLKLISQTGRNTAHVDVVACTARGIVVAAAGQGSPQATCELTWGLILSAVRHIPHEVQKLKAGIWQTTVGTGLSGRTLGVYAFGRIGALVAGVGRAFGMNVVCWGREGSLAKAREAGFAVATSREAFFEEADVLTLHIPLNQETRGIVTAADLARMKSTALFVNTSRAQLVAPDALVTALKNGRPGFAAIDVYEDEPVTGGDHPLLQLDNVVCTPHLGYVEWRALEGFYSGAIDSILAFANGKPENILNPEVLERLRA